MGMHRTVDPALIPSPEHTETYTDIYNALVLIPNYSCWYYLAHYYF
jgi:hypothetical protein